jgi:hypothetical protein
MAHHPTLMARPGFPPSDCEELKAKVIAIIAATNGSVKPAWVWLPGIGVISPVKNNKKPQ